MRKKGSCMTLGHLIAQARRLIDVWESLMGEAAQPRRRVSPASGMRCFGWASLHQG